MFENIRRMRRLAPLVQEFSRHQLGESLLQPLLLERPQRLDHRIRKRPPDHCPELRQLLGRIELIQPGHQRRL